MKKLLLLALMAAGNALAGYQTTPNAFLLDKFHTYDSYGGGDVAIWISSTGISQCPDGVYISGTAAGRNTLMATMLTAVSLGTMVKLYVDDGMIWAGGGAKKLCRLDAILWGS